MGSEVTTSSEYVYFGRILNLRVDTVRLANGGVARREIVEHADAVAILPLDEQGNVLLVRQFRKPTEQELYEIPAGVIHEGEAPEETARRELAEEASLAAQTIERLAGFYTCPGFSNEYMHVFKATGLRPATATPDEDEDITLLWAPLADALRMIETGEIRDAKTIIALLMVGCER